VTGEAKNVLRVSNSALRFNPSLSPEEMRGIMVSMRQEMQERRAGSTRPEGSRPEGAVRRPDAHGPGSGQQASGRRESGMQGAQMKQFAQVWIEDENGKLKLVFIKKGVTDNTYTEIVEGDLKEGQLVITGETSGQESREGSRDRPPMGGMMRFIRR